MIAAATELKVLASESDGKLVRDVLRYDPSPTKLDGLGKPREVVKPACGAVVGQAEGVVAREDIASDNCVLAIRIIGARQPVEDVLAFRDATGHIAVLYGAGAPCIAGDRRLNRIADRRRVAVAECIGAVGLQSCERIRMHEGAGSSLAQARLGR